MYLAKAHTKHEMTHHEEQANDRVLFGFWVYLMTDLIMFGVLFATFAVLRNSTFGGHALGELFSLPFVLSETLILLVSSFTCGLAMIAAHHKKQAKTMVLFGITFLLGAAFLWLEIDEFTKLFAEGYGYQRSAAMSSFFALVGTHGLHIASGLLWMGIMMWAVQVKGLTLANVRKLTLLSLFWHFLDIVWIFIFTVVYLLAFV